MTDAVDFESEKYKNEYTEKKNFEKSENLLRKKFFFSLLIPFLAVHV